MAVGPVQPPPVIIDPRFKVEVDGEQPAAELPAIPTSVKTKLILSLAVLIGVMLISIAGLFMLARQTHAPTIVPGPTPIPPTPAPIITPSTAPNVSLVRITHHGGICPTGECSSTISLDIDGLLHFEDKVATISAAELDNLKNILGQTNFQRIKAKPFTGLCPTANDQQETIYYISTSQGEVKLASCETSIDPNSEPFLNINRLFNKYLTAN
jgi:hypothetical protein